MLIGEYTHTLDDKNRMSLPVKFRKEIGKSVVIAPGLDNCLSLFTVKEWQKISSKLSDSSMLIFPFFVIHSGFCYLLPIGKEIAFQV